MNVEKLMYALQEAIDGGRITGASLIGTFGDQSLDSLVIVPAASPSDAVVMLELQHITGGTQAVG